MTHFTNDGVVTLCDLPVVAIVWGNDPKARCMPCVNRHAIDTGWSFPLPEVAAV